VFLVRIFFAGKETGGFVNCRGDWWIYAGHGVDMISVIRVMVEVA